MQYLLSLLGSLGSFGSHTHAVSNDVLSGPKKNSSPTKTITTNTTIPTKSVVLPIPCSLLAPLSALCCFFLAGAHPNCAWAGPFPKAPEIKRWRRFVNRRVNGTLAARRVSGKDED